MTFNEMLQKMVNLETKEKISLAAEAYSNLEPTFRAIDPDTKGLVVVYALLGTSVIADGKFSEQEFAFIDGMLHAIGLNVSEDDIIDLVKMAADNPQGAYNVVKAVADALNDDGKTELITFVAAICSIDDTITGNEAKLIASLLG